MKTEGGFATEEPVGGAMARGPSVGYADSSPHAGSNQLLSPPRVRGGVIERSEMTEGKYRYPCAAIAAAARSRHWRPSLRKAGSARATRRSISASCALASSSLPVWARKAV